ncbi:MAG: hypothetical protein LH471_01305 [Salinibacterium sp.]|nr:hypothetical protein [Salinibacterium sp.]
MLDDVFSEAEDAIQFSRNKVDHAAFDRTVQALLTARRIVIVGTGFS